MRHATGVAALCAAIAFIDGTVAEAAALAALVPAGTLLTPSRLFVLAILAPVVLLAAGSLASLLADLLHRNEDR